jgi:hypothetical protein
LARVPGRRCSRYSRCRRARKGPGKARCSTPGFRCMPRLAWKPIRGEARTTRPLCESPAGTTDIVLEPLDFIARLAALVPPSPVPVRLFRDLLYL